MNDRSPIAYVVSMRTGLEAFIYRELDYLSSEGIPFVLFSTKYRKGDIYAPRPQWPHYGLPLASLAFRLPLLLLRALAHPSLLLEAVRDGGIVDLLFACHFAPIMQQLGVRQIHCHFGDHKLFIGYYCKRLTGLPLSVTIHAHELFTNPNPRLFRKALLACDRVFPIAERWRIRLRDEYLVPESKLCLNRLFVDTELYRPSSAIKVLAVGRFTRRKGFHVLLEAAKLLEDLDAVFLFVGFGPLDLRNMARERGVDHRVVVFDKLDQKQLRVLYTTADIFCLPSITTPDEGAEGIPVVLMEAMSCGLPVVATRCGAVEELVENILVDEGSPRQLAQAIRELARDPELRRREGERNRRIVEERYSVRNVKRFIEQLQAVAS